jgi:hypothetical protein
MCGVVTVIWPHSCDSQHHGSHTGSGWRTFRLQQSTVCACCIPHGCAAEHSSSTTHFSIRPVRSLDLLVFLRGSEALPQTVSQLQKAVPVFPGWSDVLLKMEVSVRHLVTGTGRCVLAGLGVLIGCHLWYECTYDWSINCELFLPRPICSMTNLIVSK